MNLRTAVYEASKSQCRTLVVAIFIAIAYIFGLYHGCYNWIEFISKWFVVR